MGDQSDIDLCLFVVCIYAYIHLRFEHAVLGTHLSCLGGMSWTVNWYILTEDRGRGLTPTHWAFQKHALGSS